MTIDTTTSLGASLACIVSVDIRPESTLITCSALGATPPPRQHQLNGRDDRFKPRFGHHRKHLRHHTVTALAPHELVL